MSRDFYEVLGVSKGASQDEIKKAFRKKAHELHPDKGGDAESFKQVNEAYQVLGDTQKRSQYDQFGHAAFQQGGPGGFGGGAGGFDFNGMNINMDDLGDFGDVLGNMFGFGGRSPSGGRRSQGKDIETTVSIDFMDAIKGVERELSLRVLASCSACKGTGAEGAKTISCTACQGSGRVTRAQRTPFGVIQTAATCAECHGRGAKPQKNCAVCSGNGIQPEQRELSVRIPQGISSGETIRIQGQGEAAPYGGKTGDLYVHVRVSSHPRFRREGNDILSEEYIPLSTFPLGGTIAVETVEGPGELHIPAGTPSGTVFKIRNYGAPSVHGRGRGDHLVTVAPEIPKKLSKEQKKILEDLKHTGM